MNPLRSIEKLISAASLSFLKIQRENSIRTSVNDASSMSDRGQAYKSELPLKGRTRLIIVHAFVANTRVDNALLINSINRVRAQSSKIWRTR